jgi:hypothetical protein
VRIEGALFLQGIAFGVLGSWLAHGEAQDGERLLCCKVILAETNIDVRFAWSVLDRIQTNNHWLVSEMPIWPGIKRHNFLITCGVISLTWPRLLQAGNEVTQPK